MNRFICFLILISILLQPLGLITPVLAEEINMKYDNTPPLHTPEVVNGVTYEYDANGNLLSDGKRTIEWDQDNRPIRITKGNEVVEFFYDASGRRTVKRSGEDKIVYVNQYYQTPNTKYYFTNGRVAQRTGDGLVFLHQDHLGSTVLATDSSSQKITEPLSYFPYGRSISNMPLAISRYLFTGQESDPESDLYNYNARLYNPTTGAFISADSVVGGNRYAYAANNPMRFIDPSGNDPEGTDMSEIMVEYGPSLATMAFFEWVASLNIPIVSPLAADIAIGSKKIIVGSITGDTALQAEGASNVAYGAIGMYTGIQAANTVVDCGQAYKAYRQAGKELYVESITAKAESYGMTVTQGCPGGGASGCVKTLGSEGTEILPGTQINQVEVVVGKGNNIATTAHELDPAQGHAGQVIRKHLAGAPDVTLSSPVSAARAGYEIEASYAGAKAAALYGTTPMDFFGGLNNASLIAEELTGGMTVYRMAGGGGWGFVSQLAFYGTLLWGGHEILSNSDPE